MVIATVYTTGVNRLINFAEDRNLSFSAIDFTLLDNFQRPLKNDGIKPNSIGNYLRSIRAIYNKAIKAKLVDGGLYSFKEIAIRTARTAKRAATSDALTRLYNWNLKPQSKEWHARNYLLLSFSLIGISFTDLANAKNFNVFRGRLTYERRKTHKTYNIKLSDLALNLLEHYQSSN